MFRNFFCSHISIKQRRPVHGLGASSRGFDDNEWVTVLRTRALMKDPHYEDDGQHWHVLAAKDLDQDLYDADSSQPLRWGTSLLLLPFQQTNLEPCFRGRYVIRFSKYWTIKGSRRDSGKATDENEHGSYELPGQSGRRLKRAYWYWKVVKSLRLSSLQSMAVLC